jgi:hypothetical protein
MALEGVDIVAQTDWVCELWNSLDAKDPARTKKGLYSVFLLNTYSFLDLLGVEDPRHSMFFTISSYLGYVSQQHSKRGMSRRGELMT